MSAAVLPMTEQAFQQRVVDFAELYGWRVHHSRPAWTGRGWRTPIQGHPGWPDLALCRGGRLLLVELKSPAGRLRPDQEAWLAELRAVAGVEVHVWRPADWDDVVRALSGE